MIIVCKRGLRAWHRHGYIQYWWPFSAMYLKDLGTVKCLLRVCRPILHVQSLNVKQNILYNTGTLVYSTKCTNITLTLELIYLLNLAESKAFSGVTVSMLSSWKGIILKDSRSNTAGYCIGYFCLLHAHTAADDLVLRWTLFFTSTVLLIPNMETTFLPWSRNFFAIKLSVIRIKGD
jgi:hypothetical protein